MKLKNSASRANAPRNVRAVQEASEKRAAGSGRRCAGRIMSVFDDAQPPAGGNAGRADCPPHPPYGGCGGCGGRWGWWWGWSSGGGVGGWLTPGVLPRRGGVRTLPGQVDRPVLLHPLVDLGPPVEEPLDLRV